jgi:hypothetical protein
MGRRGYPWHRFNGWSWLVWSSFAEGEHVEIFTTVPGLHEGWDSALHRERDVHHPFERDLDILRGHAFFLQFSLQPGV